MKLRPAGAQVSDHLIMAMISWHDGRRDTARSWYIFALAVMARSPNDDPDATRYLSEAEVALKPILPAEPRCDEPEG